MSDLPPCGLYRTGQALDTQVPTGRLVYFHNHGNPGAGVYLPRGWSHNRALWHESGITLRDQAWAHTLEPLAPEGLYRVKESFTCCDQNCRRFETEMLVQLGYNGHAEPLLFVPELTADGLAMPELGSALDVSRISSIVALKVVQARDLPTGHLLQ